MFVKNVRPKSRFRILSLRWNRSNPALFDEIATHLSGARNDVMGKGFLSLNRDLGSTLASLFNAPLKFSHLPEFFTVNRK